MVKIFNLFFTFIILSKSSFSQFYRDEMFALDISDSSKFFFDTSSRSHFILSSQYISGVQQGRNNKFYNNLPGFHTAVEYLIKHNLKGIKFIINPSIVLNKVDQKQLDSITFPSNYSNSFWITYSKWLNRFDDKLQSKDIRLFTFFPGTSHIYIDKNKYVIKAGCHKLNFGSAKSDGLILSNNAPEFFKISFHNKVDINKRGQKIKYLFFQGLLNSRSYTYDQRVFTNGSTQLFINKSHSSRFINGFEIKYLFGSKKNHFLGLNYLNIYYSSSRNIFSNTFPLISYISTARKDFENENLRMGSLFYKANFEAENLQLWVEYGYGNRPINPISLIISDTALSGYLIGLKKIHFLRQKKSYLEIYFQHSNLITSTLNNARSALSWYTSSYISQGATNSGMVIGSGIGPGGVSTYLSISHVLKNKSIGIDFERLMHNQDLFYALFGNPPRGDYRRHWMDLSIGFNISFTKKISQHNLSLSGIKSFNHQYRKVNNSTSVWKGYGYDLYGFRLRYQYSFNL